MTALKTALSQQPGLGRFWDTASEVANLCRTLASHTNNIDLDDAFTVGMFHDCGIPLIMQRYPDFKDLLLRINANPNLCSAQEQNKCYGVNHFGVGYELASTWDLRDSVRQAIKLQPFFSQAQSGEIPASDETLALVSLVLALSISAMLAENYGG